VIVVGIRMTVSTRKPASTQQMMLADRGATNKSSPPNAMKNTAGTNRSGKLFEASRLYSVLLTIFILHIHIQPVYEVDEAV
jgi:hypothetical protein